MKIGFVDHHLNNFHANKFLGLLHEQLAAEGARVVAAWESNPTGEDWCEKNKVPRLGSAAAVAEACDAVMVLAPDNIDAHLSLCRQVFPAGRPTLVDKFLAPTLDEARKIVDLAEKHRVRIFSASSLRFAGELQAALKEAGSQPTEAFARGMGVWDGYGIHTLSLVVGAFGGADATRLINTGTPESTSLAIDYADGRRAWVEVRSAANMWEVFPWSFGVKARDRYTVGTVKDHNGFYANLMTEAVKFFRTGESPVSVKEMLKIVAILEGTNASREQGGVWLPVGG